MNEDFRITPKQAETYRSYKRDTARGVNKPITAYTHPQLWDYSTELHLMQDMINDLGHIPSHLTFKNSPPRNIAEAIVEIRQGLADLKIEETVRFLVWDVFGEDLLKDIGYMAVGN